MKTTANNFEMKSGRLILGKTYFCNWAWRYARYIGTCKNDSGEMVARFRDVCDKVISIKAESAIEHIDWEKTEEWSARH
jgi:hypothetical protein